MGGEGLAFHLHLPVDCDDHKSGNYLADPMSLTPCHSICQMP